MRKYDDIKVTVVGMGYVGVSLAIMFAQHHEVTAVDIDKERVRMINEKCTPFKDEYIEKYLQKPSLRLFATTDKKTAYMNADFIIIAVPTDFNIDKNSLDTSLVESVVEEVYEINPEAVIVIKSTVPIGFTKKLKQKVGTKSLIFCPEFLRETLALYDCLYSSRIIVSKSEILRDVEMETFARLLKQGMKNKNVAVYFMHSSEAEAVKLFSNTYLAMRISFFNELDTYAQTKGLRTDVIINGICADDRIGDWYNNPSFGYGGYCLPKDSKQLCSCFENIPQSIISAVVESNEIRKQYIVKIIKEKIRRLRKKHPYKQVFVGVYRLNVKQNSDNFRDSSTYNVITELQRNCVKQDFHIVVYEPLLRDFKVPYKQINSFSKFADIADIIVANRVDKKLEAVYDKVITRDVFFRD